ncbi:hypothetical protein [Streptomyces purpureus]|uniref:Uncharacterized protein n=1 Tax=Streptomyces purpureus TaxID=1951 RepID=A0A918HCW1_9ACTN|nr:hypothetical protein [Streptomyces purpureus]GGT51417.1 hypothetical protein GCM10014713_51730 [Streptomyces purpureus]
MRITVTSGDRQVHIHIKGNSVRKLQEAEAAAQRLLDAAPKSPPKTPIGFTAEAPG